MHQLVLTGAAPDALSGDLDDFAEALELELGAWPGPPQLASQLDFHGNWLEWLLP